MFLDPEEAVVDEEGSGKDANCVLYGLFLEEMATSSHRNVKFSQEQSKTFLQHMYSRPRTKDINPYPFNIEHFITDPYAPQTTQSTDNKTDAKTQDNSSGAGGQGQSSDSDNKSKKEMSKDPEEKCPEWKCFIKSPTSSSLLITIVPASFEDVVLINKASTKPSPNSASQADDDVKNGAQNDSSEKPVSNNSNQSKISTEPVNVSELPETANQSSAADSNAMTDSNETVSSSQTLTASSNQTDELNDSISGEEESSLGNSDSERSEENMESQSENDNEDVEADKKRKPVPPKKLRLNIPKSVPPKKTFSFPVYIYDCTTQNVLDSLIFPWDFRLGPDICQDKTFDFTYDLDEMTGTASPRLMKRVSFSVESLKVQYDVKSHITNLIFQCKITITNIFL